MPFDCRFRILPTPLIELGRFFDQAEIGFRQRPLAEGDRSVLPSCSPSTSSVRPLRRNAVQEPGDRRTNDPPASRPSHQSAQPSGRHHLLAEASRRKLRRFRHGAEQRFSRELVSPTLHAKSPNIAIASPPDLVDCEASAINLRNDPIGSIPE